ncbi:MAG: EamA family transporter RarD [Anaerolineae bacterium]|nr:EamA family transporter RarD [Anaerolineae bacterium]
MNKGMWLAVGAYATWGFFPLYFKLLKGVPALEILSHRVVWALIFLVLVLTWRQQWGWLRPALKQKKVVLTFAAAGTLLAINWLTYIWGVNSGYVVETSLGYFINPLVSVFLGLIFLRERLRQGQWLAILVALVGVLYLTFSYGRPPWIALVLAFTFGTYGLLRKVGRLNSLEGLTMETGFMFLPALGFLLWQEGSGAAAFGHISWSTTFLLAFAGIATAIPLLMFGAAAREIPLNVIGILQYIAPTIQFLIGILVFREPFSLSQLVGFSFIWVALVLYTVESLFQTRRRRILQYAGGDCS